MAHKTDRNDVFVAFARYQELTLDFGAFLEQDGGYWRVASARYRELEGYGKATILGLLERFCDGWEAGRKAALEAILNVKVKKGDYEN